MTTSHLQASDIRAVARLVTDAALGLTDLVEDLHAHIAHIARTARTPLLLGDGLVPLESAFGHHEDPVRRLAFP